jgi:hypothetical protein
MGILASMYLRVITASFGGEPLFEIEYLLFSANLEGFGGTYFAYISVCEKKYDPQTRRMLGFTLGS